jgi:hypothetical protein
MLRDYKATLYPLASHGGTGSNFGPGHGGHFVNTSIPQTQLDFGFLPDFSSHQSHHSLNATSLANHLGINQHQEAFPGKSKYE